MNKSENYRFCLGITSTQAQSNKRVWSLPRLFSSCAVAVAAAAVIVVVCRFLVLSSNFDVFVSDTKCEIDSIISFSHTKHGASRYNNRSDQYQLCNKY